MNTLREIRAQTRSLCLIIVQESFAFKHRSSSPLTEGKATIKLLLSLSEDMWLSNTSCSFCLSIKTCVEDVTASHIFNITSAIYNHMRYEILYPSS
jgi:hypothetical protein